MRDGSTRGKGKTPVIAAVLLLVLAALMVTAGLFLADPDFDGSEPEPAGDDAVLTAAGCVLSGEGFSLTEGQVCGLIAAQLEETPVSWLDPQSLRVRTDGEQRLTVYAPVSWNGLTLHVTAEFLLTADASEKRLTAELTGAAQLAGPAEIERLRASAAWLNYESQIFEMQKHVITLEHSYYISGFVPEETLPVLRSALAGLEGVEATEEPLDKDAAAVHPPVKLKNNFFARPFEMFIEMYGLPSYNDVDPTPFVALTYSILFGAMFGDVGQGIVLGLVGYFIMYKKFKLGIGLVLTRCSVFSTLFGFLYGSVFGFEHVLDPMFHALGFAEKPIEALTPEGIITLLLSSVAAGAFLIIVAMATGVYSCVRRGEKARALFSANGVAGIVFYFSLLMLLLKYAAGIALPFVGTVPFYALCLALPFVCIYFSEPLTKKLSGEQLHETVGEMLMNGFFEMFDALLSFASNTMSFLRVGGFTLAHAGMMTMVFTLAEMTPNVVFYALVVVIGNIAVMGLEGLFVAIQVLRLEFYEMFSRFFEADGEPFRPLCIRPIGQA